MIVKKVILLLLFLSSSQYLAAITYSTEIYPQIQFGIPYSSVTLNLSYFPYNPNREEMYSLFEKLNANRLMLGLVVGVGLGKYLFELGPNWIEYSVGTTTAQVSGDPFQGRLQVKGLFLNEIKTDGSQGRGYFGVSMLLAMLGHVSSEFIVGATTTGGTQFPFLISASFGYCFD